MAETALNFYLIGLISLLLFNPLAYADSTFQSGERQIALIELYSSEGCSSCPPADRWLANLKDHKKLWREFVPLNFHVDYWNRLGWVDRFSNQEFSQRQRRFASEWGSGRVYTPGFVRNGSEWKQRQLTGLLGQSVGSLRAVAIGDGRYKVTFAGKAASTKKHIVHFSLLGHGLTTEVKYGENAGETLSHEFVVLAKNKKAMTLKNGVYETIVKLPTNTQAGAKNFSVAFWVSREGSQKPIQAVGGFLAKK